MASDRQQYSNALRRWDRLQDSGALSIPRDVGSVAIMCSYQRGTPAYGIPAERMTEFVSPEDGKKFRREALAIARVLRAQKREPELFFDPAASDFRDVLRDPSISDIIVIGHGSLSSLGIKDLSHRNTYTWLNVSEDADHLKTGLFVQRTCGSFRYSLSVPLGLFAVEDHRNVTAPVNYYFAPTDLDHPHNQLIQPVTDLPRMTYAQVRGAFPHERAPILPPPVSASATI